MRESYLACFPGGTSGRFILHIMWRIVTGQDYSIKFDEVNSTHLESPWYSFYFDIPTSGPDSLSSQRLFSAMKLNESVQHPCPMAFCHVFPDFDILRTKAPNTKLVLISYCYNDIVEVATNCIRKNLIVPEKLAIEQGIKDLIRCYSTYPFSEENLTLDSIPEDFRSKTLIIRYSDIYNKDGEEYTAVSKIENFLQKKIGPTTRKSYETYVANRIKTGQIHS